MSSKFKNSENQMTPGFTHDPFLPIRGNAPLRT